MLHAILRRTLNQVYLTQVLEIKWSWAPFLMCQIFPTISQLEQSLYKRSRREVGVINEEAFSGLLMKMRASLTRTVRHPEGRRKRGSVMEHTNISFQEVPGTSLIVPQKVRHMKGKGRSEVIHIYKVLKIEHETCQVFWPSYSFPSNRTKLSKCSKICASGAHNARKKEALAPWYVHLQIQGK